MNEKAQGDSLNANSTDTGGLTAEQEDEKKKEKEEKEKKKLQGRAWGVVMSLLYALALVVTAVLVVTSPNFLPSIKFNRLALAVAIGAAFALGGAALSLWVAIFREQTRAPLVIAIAQVLGSFIALVLAAVETSLGDMAAY